MTGHSISDHFFIPRLSNRRKPSAFAAISMSSAAALRRHEDIKKGFASPLEVDVPSGHTGRRGDIQTNLGAIESEDNVGGCALSGKSIIRRVSVPPEIFISDASVEKPILGREAYLGTQAHVVDRKLAGRGMNDPSKGLPRTRGEDAEEVNLCDVQPH